MLVTDGSQGWLNDTKAMPAEYNRAMRTLETLRNVLLDVGEDQSDNALIKKARQLHKMASDNPICPDCKRTMIKFHREDEDGDWMTYWSCECKTPQAIIDKSEQIRREENVKAAQRRLQRNERAKQYRAHKKRLSTAIL